jgi:hypothetical protein
MRDLAPEIHRQRPGVEGLVTAPICVPHGTVDSITDGAKGWATLALWPRGCQPGAYEREAA